jgi:hypothetical protein
MSNQPVAINRQENKMNQKYRISIKVKDISTNIADDSVDLEIYLKDLLVNATLPALGMELLSIDVHKARK